MTVTMAKPALQSRSSQRMFSRQFGLSFSYRFGTGQQPQKQQPTSSTAGEDGRL